MVLQYLDDVCESANLTTVYFTNPSFGEKNLEPIFLDQCVRYTNQRNNVSLRMLVKTDSGEEGCHE